MIKTIMSWLYISNKTNVVRKKKREKNPSHTIEHPIPLLLALVSMNAHSWPAVTHKIINIR